MNISVRICGFEAGNVADLRPDFGIFVDNKYWELPGSCNLLAYYLPEQLLDYAVWTLYGSRQSLRVE